MATSLDDLRGWFEKGKLEGATHMIIVCDIFDYEDYPVYVLPKEDVRDKAFDLGTTNMQKVMEVYDLRKDIEGQMKPGTRVFNY